MPRDDTYKSHTVHVPSGEPPNSLSRPPAKRKPGVVRPITQGKLLRKGGPDKPKAALKPRPIPQALPGKSAAPPPAFSSAPATSSKPAAPKPASTGAGASRAPPAPPRAPAPPPPPPPAEPDVPLYKAKYAFQGQEGEMSMKKDDLLELVEKDDNGWWLVKKDGTEGWAPSNYLELVPPKPKAAPAPPPPPPANRRPPPPPGGQTTRPASAFPSMGTSNGSAASWKRASTLQDSSDSSPASSRPGSSLANKPPPPLVGTKPKPVVAAKPGGLKVHGKPPVPSAPRPTSVAQAPRPGGGVKPSGGAPGQLDLAAAVSFDICYVDIVGTHTIFSSLLRERNELVKIIEVREYLQILLRPVVAQFLINVFHI